MAAIAKKQQKNTKNKTKKIYFKVKILAFLTFANYKKKKIILYKLEPPPPLSPTLSCQSN